MALDDYKINNWTGPVVGMPDRPSASGWTKDQVKSGFDSNSNQLKNSLNGLITELEDYVDEAHGVFIAAVGDTTYAEVDAAVTAGRTVLAYDSTLETSYVLCLSGASGAQHFYEFSSIRPTGYVSYCRIYSLDGWDDNLTTNLAPIDSPNFSGNPTAPTQTAGNNSTRIATTAFVQTAISGKLDKSGGTMTGALTLAGAPSNDLDAATKKYVDDRTAADAELYIIDYYNPPVPADVEAAYQAEKAIYVNLMNTLWPLTKRVSSTDFIFVSPVIKVSGEYRIYTLEYTPYWSTLVYKTLQEEITASGLLKGDGDGGVTAAVSGTDYQAPLSPGTDYQTPLVAGTDYQTPLPSQTGNSGKFLTTDGTDMSWAAVSAALPSQTGNSGKFLTTDGTDASWAAVPTELFFAEYGVTTYAEITAAISAGKTPMCYYDKKMYYFAKNNPPNPYTFYAQDILSKFELICESNDTWNSMSKTAQTKITASGLLKGDGNGGVTAAVSGTDYQAPLTAGTDYQTPLPSQTGNSGKFLTTDGTDMSWAAVPKEVFIATYGTTTSADIEAAYQAGKAVFCVDTMNRVFALNYRISSTIHQFMAFTKKIQMVAECNNNTWSFTNVNLQGKITASGLLKGDGDGGVTAAVSGTDYQAPLTAGTDYQTPLPSQTGNSGKFLTTNGTTMSWASAGGGADSTYECTYGTTTNAEIETALTAKKILYCIYNDRLYTFGYKGSSTNHYFYAWQGETKYYIRCNNGSWTNSSVSMAKTASPTFTGNPTAPTQTAGDSSQKLATTEFVTTAISTAIVAAIGEGY